MIDIRDREHDKMWDSIHTLSSIDADQAKAVFKAVVERSLQQIGMFTPFVSSIPLKLPSAERIQLLKELEKEVRDKLIQKEEDKAYELLVEYIDALSDLTELDSKLIRKRLIASILKQSHQQRRVPYRIINRKSKNPIATVSEEDGPSYYTPNRAAKRLGVSDQTVRRMCDKGKFPGAYQTDGGHWKIPKHALITTEEQDQKAEQLFQRIDTKNTEAGYVNEFDL